MMSIIDFLSYSSNSKYFFHAMSVSLDSIGLTLTVGILSIPFTVKIESIESQNAL